MVTCVLINIVAYYLFSIKIQLKLLLLFRVLVSVVTGLVIRTTRKGSFHKGHNFPFFCFVSTNTLSFLLYSTIYNLCHNKFCIVFSCCHFHSYVSDDVCYQTQNENQIVYILLFHLVFLKYIRTNSHLETGFCMVWINLCTINISTKYYCFEINECKLPV